MNTETLREVKAVYEGADGDATKRLYARLEAAGVAGVLAVNLFRACKSSERAKVYRGRGYRGMAYDRKQWSIDNLCTTLLRDSAAIGIPAWGWARDDKAIGYENVLYVELPTGQVSFHNPVRGVGPDYGKPWDGAPKGTSAGRIIQWCAILLEEVPIIDAARSRPAEASS